MSEIKVRVYDKKKKEMYLPEEIHSMHFIGDGVFQAVGLRNGGMTFAKDCELMLMFNGRKDKKKKPIFEGDVVKFRRDFTELIGVVGVLEDGRFEIGNLKNKIRFNKKNKYWFDYLKNPDVEVEVISDIFTYKVKEK